MNAKKLGRPTDSVKDYMLRVRLDSETTKKLETVSKNTNSSKSEIVRKGIEIQYDELNKNKR